VRDGKTVLKPAAATTRLAEPAHVKPFPKVRVDFFTNNLSFCSPAPAAWMTATHKGNGEVETAPRFLLLNTPTAII
jgi:hypothetical protein